MKTSIKTILAGTLVFAAFFGAGTLAYADHDENDYSGIYDAAVSGLWNPYPVYGNENGPDEEEVTPIVRTMGAAGITQSVATIQVFYDSNFSRYNNMTDLPQLYVEYGTSSSMGYMTPAIPQGTGSRVLLFRLSNLEEDTTYYYRAVFLHHGEVVRGSRLSFTTLEQGETPIVVSTSNNSSSLFGTVVSYNSPSTSSPIVVSNGSNQSSPSTTSNTSSHSNNTPTGSQNQVAGISQTSNEGVVTGSSGNVSLRITNGESQFEEGDRVRFNITISNTGTTSARSGRVIVALPSEYAFVKSSEGSFDERDNELAIRLATLAGGSSKTITVDARVSDVREDDSITTRAVLTFTKSDIAYTVRASDTDDIEAVSGNILGASVFGAGFFPQSLAGWVVLIIIITALIFVIRRYSKGNS